MLGWVINVADQRRSELVERQQTPCFYVKDGAQETPVWEVWFWHGGLQRWFVMSTVMDINMVKAGVSYFWPGDTAALRAAIVSQGGEVRG